ncbi:MAG: hypothetical protein H7Z11_22685 [Verrucomicrobia bacterium]|nr:hypothetical protein [Leptolyngbya sp. ES-bin-22]
MGRVESSTGRADSAPYTQARNKRYRYALALFWYAKGFKPPAVREEL